MKELPYSHEAEMAILGSLLMYPELKQEVEAQDLLAEEFYAPEHKLIFTAMMAIIEGDRTLSATSLVTLLKDQQVLDRIGGVPYLTSLAQNSATPASVRDYIDIVQEKAQKRQMIASATSIVEKGFDTLVDHDEFLDYAERVITQITRIRKTGDMRRSDAVVEDFLKNLDRIRSQGDRITGLRTGYRSLNNVTSGLQRGDLIILAARPSVGKTAFALNLALNVARHNKEGKAGVAVFSLEMPDVHLMARMLAAQSAVASEFLRNGNLNDAQLNALHTGANVLSQLNIFIDDSSSITLTDIFSKCRKLKAEGTLEFIIIDYIQLINSRSRSENRQQEVSEISRGLKQLAREMEVPVLALSQLSRSVEKREVKIPQLSDLRESGSIEQDADIVMFLYREDYHNNISDEDTPQDKNDTKNVLVKISKHRNGALADIEMQFKPAVSRFYDIERRKEG